MHDSADGLHHRTFEKLDMDMKRGDTPRFARDTDTSLGVNRKVYTLDRTELTAESICLFVHASKYFLACIERALEVPKTSLKNGSVDGII